MLTLPDEITQAIRFIFAGCCARATSGHTATAPPRSVMNLRRLIEPPEECLIGASSLAPCDSATNKEGKPIDPKRPRPNVRDGSSPQNGYSQGQSACLKRGRCDWQPWLRQNNPSGRIFLPSSGKSPLGVLPSCPRGRGVGHRHRTLGWDAVDAAASCARWDRRAG